MTVIFTCVSSLIFQSSRVCRFQCLPSKLYTDMHYVTTRTWRVQFCRSCVEPMGEESDHVHIIALSDALGVPVRVVYLDQSGDMNDKPVTVNKHDFIPEGMNTAVDPDVILLYRPGHYDILYRRGNSGNVKHTSLEESNVEHF